MELSVPVSLTGNNWISLRPDFLQKSAKGIKSKNSPTPQLLAVFKAPTGIAVPVKNSILLSDI